MTHSNLDGRMANALRIAAQKADTPHRFDLTADDFATFRREREFPGHTVGPAALEEPQLEGVPVRGSEGDLSFLVTQLNGVTEHGHIQF